MMIWTKVKTAARVIATITLLCGGGTAADYYVDQNHAQADDTNAGTEALPWKTLAKAGTTAEAGDTVWVKAGTFCETFTPVNPGTAGNLVTFKVFLGDSVVLDAEGISFAVYLDGTRYTKLEGFEIRNSSQSGVYITGDNIGIEIVNNNVHDCCKNQAWGGGIRVLKATDLLIQDNEIHHNDANGIWIETANEDIINPHIVGNHIYANGTDGINGGGGSNWLIEGNVIHDHENTNAHPDGIQIQRGNLDGLVIRNNIFYDATQNIFVANHIYGTIENVEIYGNLIYRDDYDYAYPAGIIVAGKSEPLGFVRNAKIYNNSVYGTQSGIVFATNLEGDVTIRNNILSNTATAISVMADVTATIDSDYNLIYDSPIKWYGTWYNTFTEFRQATGLEPNSIAADPEFVDPSSFDFHLQSTSPAIDGGDPELATIFDLPDPFLDMDGNSRLADSGCDMGAYEYVPDSVVVVITTHPAGASVAEGETATFAVVATGEAPLSYQWQVDAGLGWQDIGGATESSYTTLATTLADDGNQYRCVVSNALPSEATSDAATLTVLPHTVTVTAPTGGQSFKGKQDVTITWTGTLPRDVRIEFTEDGTAWQEVVGPTANDGSHTCALENVASASCAFRVSDASDGDPFGVSGTFSVTQITDVDDDRMDDGWELLYWETIEESGGTGDTDGDGLTDLEEFWLDRDPTVKERSGTRSSGCVPGGSGGAALALALGVLLFLRRGSHMVWSEDRT